MSTADFLKCNRCGKSVSTAFIPVPTDTPDGGIIVRAWIECPECIEKKTDPERALDKIRGLAFWEVSDTVQELRTRLACIGAAAADAGAVEPDSEGSRTLLRTAHALWALDLLAGAIGEIPAAKTEAVLTLLQTLAWSLGSLDALWSGDKENHYIKRDGTVVHESGFSVPSDMMLFTVSGIPHISGESGHGGRWLRVNHEIFLELDERAFRVLEQHFHFSQAVAEAKEQNRG